MFRERTKKNADTFTCFASEPRKTPIHSHVSRGNQPKRLYTHMCHKGTNENADTLSFFVGGTNENAYTLICVAREPAKALIHSHFSAREPEGTKSRRAAKTPGWPPDIFPTEGFLPFFFSPFVCKGNPKAKAVRGKIQHPYYWAPCKAPRTTSGRLARRLEVLCFSIRYHRRQIHRPVETLLGALEGAQYTCIW